MGAFDHRDIPENQGADTHQETYDGNRLKQRVPDYGKPKVDEERHQILFSGYPAGPGLIELQHLAQR